MPAERTRWRKFPKLVAYHVLCHKHWHKAFTIVHGKC